MTKPLLLFALALVWTSSADAQRSIRTPPVSAQGYQFAVKSAEVAPQAAQGTALRFRLQITNEGTAPLMERRDVRLVLRGIEADYSTSLGLDPRRWLPGKEIRLDTLVHVPEGFPEGAYDVLIHLPDPMLRTSPEYAVRFASGGIFEAETGYNDVGLRTRITEDAPPVVAPSAYEQEAGLPAKPRLYANHPNPFARETTIRFALPSETSARLTVHDLLGHEVYVVLDARLRAGRYRIAFDGRRLPSGLYLARLTTDAGTSARIMTLIK